MRITLCAIAAALLTGLMVAACEAGRLNTELARLGAVECATYDCWE
jgi:hypothetical protein